MNTKIKVALSLFLIIAVIAFALLVPTVTTISVSEANARSSVRNIGRDHSIYLDENRMLFYNGEEKFLVPEGKRVVLRASRIGNPSFTVED